MSDRVNNILKIMSYFSIGLTSVFMICVISCLMVPYKTVDIKNIKVSAYDGKNIEVAFTFTKYVEMPAVFSVDMIPVDTNEKDMKMVYSLLSGQVNSPKGMYTTYKHLVVPAEAIDGFYKIQLTLKYDVNAIRTITRVFQTENGLYVISKRKPR